MSTTIPSSTSARRRRKSTPIECLDIARMQLSDSVIIVRHEQGFSSLEIIKKMGSPKKINVPVEVALLVSGMAKEQDVYSDHTVLYFKHS